MNRSTNTLTNLFVKKIILGSNGILLLLHCLTKPFIIFFFTLQKITPKKLFHTLNKLVIWRRRSMTIITFLRSRDIARYSHGGGGDDEEWKEREEDRALMTRLLTSKISLSREIERKARLTDRRSNWYYFFFFLLNVILRRFYLYMLLLFLSYGFTPATWFFFFLFFMVGYDFLFFRFLFLKGEGFIIKLWIWVKVLLCED
jgi:hypothetical protein